MSDLLQSLVSNQSSIYIIPIVAVVLSISLIAILPIHEDWKIQPND